MKLEKNSLTYIILCTVLIILVCVAEKIWISSGDNESIRDFSMWIYMIYMITPAILIVDAVIALRWDIPFGMILCTGVILAAEIIAGMAFVFSPDSLIGYSGQPIFFKFMILIVVVFYGIFGLLKLIFGSKSRNGGSI